LDFRDNMESQADHPTSSLGRPGSPLPAGTLQRARILLVEDDEDTRQLLALALSGEDYAVDQASTAAQGLERLRRTAYQLVLTDYDLPGMTGSAMLKEAARQGLLRAAATVVVTAHPSPEGVEPAGLMRKPLQLAEFLKQVRHILVGMTGETADPAVPGGGAVPVGEPHPQVELVLYVTADSAACQRARSHLVSALSAFDPSQIRLDICDVGQDPQRGEADHVVFTPTLVTRCGGVANWVLGDLGDRTMLIDLLHVYGVEPRR
jgi:DNA-binding response OmpR family regulator